MTFMHLYSHDFFLKHLTFIRLFILNISFTDLKTYYKGRQVSLFLFHCKLIKLSRKDFLHMVWLVKTSLDIYTAR